MLGIGQENWMRRNIGCIVYMSRPPETPTEVAFSPPPKKYKTSNGPAEQPYLHGHAEQPNGPVEKTPIQRMNQPYDGVKTVHESQYENHTKLYDALHLRTLKTPIFIWLENQIKNVS